MYQLSTILAVFAITAVNAVPLNINLGAYSPALVVGDGEISFGTAADVSGVINSLQGATVGAGAAAAVAAAAPAATPAAAKVVEAADVTSVIQQQQQADQPAAAAPTTTALASGLGLGPDKKFILPREPVAEANPDMEEALQILRRDVASIKEGRGVESKLTARDLASFQAALNFATAAMKVSPPVELGTGEGGSGVGIKVGSGASGSVATAPAAKAAGKRGLAGVTAIKVISKRDTPNSG